ncbi:winged helix-turn-helix domain-containing protein [Vibrio hannami]|uniref:winged helix-turn-helix domain-containing protein n=1 Tax=Vibrio hannami TaxID=2717094 RepID=UPI00240F5C5F|nr:winged helix-turn-helix domain-containing protein [Vibrio hannami]MDG3088421.1 winged helix-turn-helix domain-containing protein [Vibrio hannami]
MALIFNLNKTILIDDRYAFQPKRHELIDCLKGNKTVLSESSSRLLYFLATHSGQKLRKQRIIKYVWNDIGRVVQTSSLVQAIHELRKAFGERGLEQQCIITVPNYGYTFTSKVEIEDEHDDTLPAKDKSENSISIDPLQQKSGLSRFLNKSVAVWLKIRSEKRLALASFFLLLSILTSAAHLTSNHDMGVISSGHELYILDHVGDTQIFSTRNALPESLLSSSKKCVNSYLAEQPAVLEAPRMVLITENITGQASLHLVFDSPYQHLNKSIRANDKQEFYEDC